MTIEKNGSGFVAPVTIQAGQIQFIEACLPPLRAGKYRVKMTQVIKASEASDMVLNSDPYEDTLDFRVDAPQFTLNPADIHSVYPPVDQSGRYDNSLPHVVFSRRTLPWERTIAGVEDSVRPWMGLLLLTEDELRLAGELQNKPGGRAAGPILASQSLPVIDENQDSLLIPSEKNVAPPDLQQSEAGSVWKQERFRFENERCLALDLPGELFKAVAPRDRDLPYLAHVRQIDTADKEILAINDRGWFSLVLGNRLPVAGIDAQTSKPVDVNYYAFLVSLEGMKQYIKDDWQPTPGQWLRMAVLGSWRFTATAAVNDFKIRMDLLNFNTGTALDPDARKLLPDSWLRLPHQTPVIDSNEPDQAVNAALARGYTAFNHSMRHGEQTVSWFRGPLTPVYYAKPHQVEEPAACADQLLRYNPGTGMFDVSYASAWQLGRLLALQNQGFALSLNRVRQTLRATAEQTMHRAELMNRHDFLKNSAEDGVEESLIDKLIAKLQPGVAKDQTSTWFDSPVLGADPATQPDPAKPFKTYAEEALEKSLEQRSLNSILQDVSAWLSRLVLLYGVPFSYLIPDENMLPEETIRFFYLDPVWIQYLVQGACSVGSNGFGDSLIDQAMNRLMQSDAAGDKSLTASAAGVRGRLRQQLEGVEPQPGDNRLNWPLTGFLLRSSVVNGWRGMEITARDAQGASLDPLRIEQLSADVMLGLFNGKIGILSINQPQEGLHFGLTPDNGSYAKKLRALTGKIGEPIESTISLSAPGQIRDQKKGVINIAGLADEMKQKLSGLKQLHENRFTSAEFAIQMIEAPGKFNFMLKGGN